MDDNCDLDVDVLRWGIPFGRDWVDRLDLFLVRPLAILLLCCCSLNWSCCVGVDLGYTLKCWD
jgi:hypothetical protein